MRRLVVSRVMEKILRALLRAVFRAVAFFFVFCGVSRQIIAPSPGGNIVLADNGPMFKEMYAKAFNLLYKTVTSCTCSRPSSKPSAKTAKSRRPTAPSFLNQQPVLNTARSYIDPSYMVRSVAADTKDSHMCYLLASQVQCSILNGKSLCGECEMLASRWCMAPCTVSRASGLCARARYLLRLFVPHLFASVCLVNNRTVYAARCHVFVLLTGNLFCLCFCDNRYVPLADLACKKPNEGRVSITGRQCNPTQP